MKQKLLTLGVLVLAVLLLVGLAPRSSEASGLVAFHVVPDGGDGVINFSAPIGNVAGWDIAIASVSRGPTEIALADAFLSFNAGPGGLVGPGVYSYSPVGSSILITGQLDVDGDGAADTAYTAPLMQGYLTGNLISGGTVDVINTYEDEFLVISMFQDQKNAAMLYALGAEDWGNVDELVPDNPDFDGFFHLGFNAELVGMPNCDEYWESTRVLSGDVDNYVPIPSAVLLLGSGLFGLIGLRRKFQS